MSEKNPYSAAAAAYGHTAASVDPRALEGKVLLQAATRLELIANRLRDGEKVSFLEVGEAVEYNQKLWVLFVDDSAGDAHPLPQEIKNNIVSLGIFVFKRSRDILIDATADKFKVLIDINRNIAAGLMKQQSLPAMPPVQRSGDDKRTDSQA
jgi:flagellar biosynthesis activator protein FlaF